MDLRQLEVLRAVAETGSFSEAGRRLNLTQPAVSHHVRLLEEELGETLVLRTRPLVRLSDAGESVLATAESVLDDIAGLRRRFRAEGGDWRGVLRVTASPLGIVYLYGDLLGRFIAAHPAIEVILTAVETPYDGVRQVAARRADVAFTPFPVDDDTLERVELGETDHVVIAAPRHPLAARRAVTVAEVRRHPFVRYQTGAGSRLVTDALFGEHGGYGRIFLESNDTEFVKRIVALGLAVTLVPRFTVSAEIADRRLVGLAVRESRLTQAFGFVYRRDMHMRALRAFVDFCVRNRDAVRI